MFGFESGLIGVLQLQSTNPNWTPSFDVDVDDQQLFHGSTHNTPTTHRNVMETTRLGSNKKGYNLQLHDIFNEMSITSIKISKTTKCFYVGTTEGIVSCVKYEVSKNRVSYFIHFDSHQWKYNCCPYDSNITEYHLPGDSFYI